MKQAPFLTKKIKLQQRQMQLCNCVLDDVVGPAKLGTLLFFAVLRANILYYFRTQPGLVTHCIAHSNSRNGNQIEITVGINKRFNLGRRNCMQRNALLGDLRNRKKKTKVKETNKSTLEKNTRTM